MTFDNDAGTACDRVGTTEHNRGTAGDGTTFEGGAAGTDGEASKHRIEDGQSPSEAVVQAVAARFACDAGAESKLDPTELDPLYEAIEPDALDALFAPLGDRQQAAGAVSFTYSGYRVTVESEGSVTVATR